MDGQINGRINTPAIWLGVNKNRLVLAYQTGGVHERRHAVSGAGVDAGAVSQQLHHEVMVAVAHSLDQRRRLQNTETALIRLHAQFTHVYHLACSHSQFLQNSSFHTQKKIVCLSFFHFCLPSHKLIFVP